MYRKIALAAPAIWAVVTVLLLAPDPVWAAPRERVLHSFSANDMKDGIAPVSRLVADAAGNLYGTTEDGGDFYDGTVFKLVSGANGKWKETIVHTFNFADGKGAFPIAGLTIDSKGNLYGTTSVSSGCGADDCGNVFQLAPRGNGKWAFTVLHTFNGKDGDRPSAGVIFDSAGNLYGTTYYGGDRHVEPCDIGCGVVFRLAPGSNGEWTETVLHSFSFNDGFLPGDLLLDRRGNLYGATVGGGRGACSDGCGTVFKLAPRADGRWTETVLHKFNQIDGATPFMNGGPVMDGAGSLYGTTRDGGNPAYCSAPGCGTVFKLSPTAGGKWREILLHSFNYKDGAFPVSGVIFDEAGSLYGTAGRGGTKVLCDNDTYTCGNVFKLTPGSNGRWTETVLHNFRFNDGGLPGGGLLRDAAGNLFGTTIEGGSTHICDNGCGVVFEITP